MKNKNFFFKLLIIFGIILFAVVAFVIMKSTATVTAIVPTQTISSGTRLDESMLQAIQIPADTPKGFITDKSSLIGQKLKVTVDENQLLYINDVMASWDDFNSGESIPDDYIVTSIQIPSNRAVGGLVTAGDVVDILGVPNKSYSNTSNETMANYLGDMSKYSYGANGIHVYWVLSNVKILETDSTLAQNDQSSISSVTGEDGNSSEGAFYIVALSYQDYQKLRLSEEYLDLWMNIAPEYNIENGPLLDQMRENVIKELMDSQSQSKIPEDDKLNENLNE